MKRIVSGVAGIAVIGVLVLMGFAYGGGRNPRKCGSGPCCGRDDGGKGCCSQVAGDCREGGGCLRASDGAGACPEMEKMRMRRRGGRWEGGACSEAPAAASEAPASGPSRDCAVKAVGQEACGRRCEGCGCGDDCRDGEGCDCPQKCTCEERCGQGCGCEDRGGCRPCGDCGGPAPGDAVRK